ncbi:MAG TPA: bifunctional lysylphosphatidylglycerol flippase/synthetase MprF [Longimicrobiaceae bacterium]|nr:bifunctional lysylphosphatidylglycerol flippase/synthetase MprF [Longimicrobiaceae bacterium]
MTAPPPPDYPETGPLQRLAGWAVPFLGAALFAAAVWVLHRELHQVRYRQVVQAFDALPPGRVAAAAVLTLLDYLVLTGYDQLAFAYVGRKVARTKVIVASFIGYAISNNVGFSILSGTSVRYRFYTRWGLSASELSRIVVFYSGTFWLGLMALGGWTLAFFPHPGMLRLPGNEGARALGGVLFATAVAYVVAAALVRGPVRLGRVRLWLPPPRIVLAQFAISALDWALAAAVLYALLPTTLRLSYDTFLGAFLVAQLLGLVSHVPGGLGVFEGAMIVLLRPYVSAQELLSSLVLFRVVYYLFPLTIALVVLVGDEAWLRRKHLARWGGVFGHLTVELAPKLLAVFTFLAGALLLFSGATPEEHSRLQTLAKVFPLAVFEAWHFVGSVVGVGLLVIAHGVWRRLDVAYYLAMLGLALGIAASLLKGGDYEEAILLAGVLVAFLPARKEFDRRAAFFAAPFSPTWVAATLAVVGASIWLGLFAFRHVEYSSELWWRFALQADAPRFLRASVGATLAVLVVGVLRLFKPAPPEIHPPTDEELADATRAIETQDSTLPYLVYLRDKTLLFSEEGDAFLMYGVQGRSWVALAGSVGPAKRRPELLRAFLERVDDYGGWPVFYQIPPDRLHHLADYGLTFAKLGEEARVPLAEFSLDGADRKPFRLAMNRFAREEGTYRIVPPEEVPALMPELRRISDEWLASKRAAEKGFSLGFFDPESLARFPVALVEMHGKPVAFTNLWPGPRKEELSVDLMRFAGGGPRNLNLMDVLFVQTMLWGREQGYRWFNLGMAPLSGLESSAVAPLWMRFGSFVYRHGNAFYNFEGLRLYKAKFHPVWEPRYLAYPGGLALPRILADVAALIAGGYRRIFR